MHGIGTLRSAQLLGAPGVLPLKRTHDGVAVRLPALPDALLHQPAWVIKLSR